MAPDADDIHPSPSPTALNPTLVKKLILLHQQQQQQQQQPQQQPQGDAKKPMILSKDATLAAAELLRRFILEARSRALIEAECDMSQTEDGMTLIRPDHITKIAAELLMDFS